MGVEPDSAARFFSTVETFSTVLAIKLYRLRLEEGRAIPILPCLDHEAMLHEGIAPHAAAYLQDADGHLHEVVYVPAERRIAVDTVSTMGECSPQAHERFLQTLKDKFPGLRIAAVGPSWLKGDLRVAKACRAQVTLRDVLTGADIEHTKASVDRLQTISVLMEKESRVASWGARTVMTPLLAVVGFLTYQLLGALGSRAGYGWAPALRYVIIGLLGGYFLYYGLKAVQLTQMANRVWKRSAEYGLILAERWKLARESMR